MQPTQGNGDCSSRPSSGVSPEITEMSPPFSLAGATFRGNFNMHCSPELLTLFQYASGCYLRPPLVAMSFFPRIFGILTSQTPGVANFRQGSSGHLLRLVRYHIETRNGKGGRLWVFGNWQRGARANNPSAGGETFGRRLLPRTGRNSLGRPGWRKANLYGWKPSLTYCIIDG
jgi:hypothetical protein